MKHILIIGSLMLLFVVFIPKVEAHQSGCHRWHSCPSDTGSYICGDLGYACQYSTYSSGSNSTYSSPSYTSSYNSYTSTYKMNSDCPSYGFAYLGSCYELPDHAKKSYLSGFTCDYGYEEVGYGLSKKCLPEIANGYRIGTYIYCNYGYEFSRNQCVKKGSNSYSYGLTDHSSAATNSCPKNSSINPLDIDSCTCDLGYEPNKDKTACKKISRATNDKLCQADFGKRSVWSGKYNKEKEVPTCQCKDGYEWNSKGTSCIKEK